jgi:RNA polymerase II-associated factor 1
MGGRFEDDDGLGRLQRVAQDEDLEQSSEAEDEMSE